MLTKIPDNIIQTKFVTLIHMVTFIFALSSFMSFTHTSQAS